MPRIAARTIAEIAEKNLMLCDHGEAMRALAGDWLAICPAGGNQVMGQ